MEDYQILKELALEFESSRDPAIFATILIRVEKFLFSIIHKAMRCKPYLRKIELQDHYQTAVLGLYKALLKVKKDEPGSKLIYKIRRYVNNEIAKCNRKTNKVSFPFSVADIAFQVHLHSADMPQSEGYIGQIENKLVERGLVYKNLELEFVRERFSKLIEEDVLSFEEFEMLVMRFVNEMTYKDIAKQVGTTSITVSKKIENTLNILKFEFRRRNWENLI